MYAAKQRKQSISRVQNISKIRTVSQSKDFKMLQRKIICNDDNIKPICEVIKDEDVYKKVDKVDKIVTIKKGLQSQNEPLENGDVEITISENHLNKGLTNDYFSIDQKNDILIYEIFGPDRLIYDVTGMYLKKTGLFWETYSKELKPLSAPTILLHELRHALQFFDATAKAKAKSGQNSDYEILFDTAKLREDIDTINLSSENWTNRMLELKKMGDYLRENEDSNFIVKNQALVDKIKLNRLKALRIVKLWIEYDVMINTEHPYADKVNEIIRLRHGEEEDQSVFFHDKTNDRFYYKIKEGNRSVIHGNGSDNLRFASDDMKKTLLKNTEGLSEIINVLMTDYNELISKQKEEC